MEEKLILAKNKMYYKNPIIILVNKRTASSSEIFAGALLDNKRVIVIGEKTFGKGYIQELRPIPPYKYGLCFTVEKYKTPNDIDINKNGITPTIYIETASNKQDKNIDKQIEKAQEILLQENASILNENRQNAQEKFSQHFI